jgi:hypothetical protein
VFLTVDIGMLRSVQTILLDSFTRGTVSTV